MERMALDYQKCVSRSRLTGIKYVITHAAVYHHFSTSTLSDRLCFVSDKCAELCKHPFRNLDTSA